jgi:hypothetical protein
VRRNCDGADAARDVACKCEKPHRSMEQPASRPCWVAGWTSSPPSPCPLRAAGQHSQQMPGSACAWESTCWQCLQGPVEGGLRGRGAQARRADAAAAGRWLHGQGRGASAQVRILSSSCFCLEWLGWWCTARALKSARQRQSTSAAGWRCPVLPCACFYVLHACFAAPVMHLGSSSMHAGPHVLWCRGAGLLHCRIGA